MGKKISIARRIIRYLTEMCYIVILYDLLFAMFSKPLVNIIYFLYIGGILAVSYVVREYCSSTVVLALIHIALIIPTIFIVRDPYLKWIIIFQTVEFFMDAMFYIKRAYTLREVGDLPWIAFTVGLITVGFAYFMKNDTLMTLGYVIPLILIFLFLMALYMEGVERYIGSSKNVTGVPIGQILSVNTVIISAIMCITFVAIFLGRLLNIEVLFAGFCKALARVAATIMVIIIMLLSFFIGLFTGSTKIARRGSGKLTTPFDSSLIADIIYFLMAAAFIAICIYALIKIFKRVLRYVLERQDRRFDETEDLGDGRDRRVIREQISDNDSDGELSSVMRARKIYKKTVLSYKKLFLPDRNDTSGDIEEAMERVTGDKDYPETLKELYNGVRYGDVIPDSQYIKRMKNQKKT